MTSTALLIMDVQQGILARVAVATRGFAAFAWTGRFTEADPAAAIPPAIAPAVEEAIVTKRRVPAVVSTCCCEPACTR
jgi:hypothetical protein